MWSRAVLGTDMYHVIHWFLVYSILGWAVESIYMSFCNRKLTNRGFVRGPFCPIYGVGALTVFFSLRKFADNYFILYLFGCLVPTILEYATARLMQAVFGEVWWDYSEKPCNYKGILCLESTIAWGAYTVGLFMFLHKMVESIVDSYSYQIGCVLGTVILSLFIIDFGKSLYLAKKEDISHHIEAGRFWQQDER